MRRMTQDILLPLTFNDTFFDKFNIEERVKFFFRWLFVH